MRPLLAFAVAVVILGGLQWYMSARQVVPPNAAVELELPSSGDFRLEITLTFDAGPDAFALEANDAPSLLVEFRGRELLREVTTVPAGTPIVVRSVTGIVEGRNEFFIQVTPQDTAAMQAHAVRVRILKDNVTMAEQTLWSEAGEPVRGAVTVDVPASHVEHHQAGRP